MNSTLTPARKSKIGLIALAYIAFISLGLPDGLLGVAWPSMRANFGIPLDSLGALLFAATTGYLTSSFFSGKIMARLGVGGLLAVSCALTGAGLIGYTLAPAWWMIVALGVVAGLGAGAIDAGINTYIASEHSEGLMQWLHASFGVGITLGPVIMTAGLNAFGKWRVGYDVVGAAQLTLALCFALTAGMWKREGQAPTPANEPQQVQDTRRILDYQTSLRSTLRRPRTWISLLLFFIYTGCELVLGYWAYTLLTESRGVAPAAAGLVTGSYWATFTLGRVLAGLYTKRIGLHALVLGSLGLALVGSVLVSLNLGQGATLAGVAITGFALAPIFPGMVSGTSDRVGPRHAANTIGMQISAAGLGGATIPSLAGVLARYTTIEAIPIFLSCLFALLITLYAASVRKPQGI